MINTNYAACAHNLHVGRVSQSSRARVKKSDRSFRKRRKSSRNSASLNQTRVRLRHHPQIKHQLGQKMLKLKQAHHLQRVLRRQQTERLLQHLPQNTLADRPSQSRLRTSSPVFNLHYRQTSRRPSSRSCLTRSNKAQALSTSHSCAAH